VQHSFAHWSPPPRPYSNVKSIANTIGIAAIRKKIFLAAMMAQCHYGPVPGGPQFIPLATEVNLLFAHGGNLTSCKESASRHQ
jgi:hypothetical protein